MIRSSILLIGLTFSIATFSPDYFTQERTDGIEKGSSVSSELTEQISLSEKSKAAIISFKLSLIDSSGYKSPWLKTIGDLNKDGKTDIIVGGYDTGGLNWYRNPDWKKFEIADGKGFSTDGEAGDINKDGLIDLVCVRSPGIVWYQNPGNPESGKWIEHSVSKFTTHDVEVTDLDVDGDIDLLVAEMTQGPDPDEIKLFLNEGKARKWKSIVIDTNGSHSMRILDANGDGYMDFFGANWRANGRDESVKLWINAGNH